MQNMEKSFRALPDHSNPVIPAKAGTHFDLAVALKPPADAGIQADACVSGDAPHDMEKGFRAARGSLSLLAQRK
jgi:hypothetical protein